MNSASDRALSSNGIINNEDWLGAAEKNISDQLFNSQKMIVPQMSSKTCMDTIDKIMGTLNDHIMTIE